MNADLAGQVVYLGLDVAPWPVTAGKPVQLTHYWRVVAPPGGAWRTFVHVQAEDGSEFQNLTHEPVQGRYPVGRWKAGDVIRDQHAFTLPGIWQHRRLEIYAGMFRGRERLPVRPGDRATGTAATGDERGRVHAAGVDVAGAVAPITVRRYRVRETSARLSVDGVLDEPAWTSAPDMGEFVDAATGWPSPRKTHGKLLWNRQTLYLALASDDHQDDETLTVILQPGDDARGKISIDVAADGRIHAGQITGQIACKAISLGAAWRAELAIPLATVGAAGRNAVWGANVLRRPGAPEIAAVSSVWSRLMDHDPARSDQLGEIVFTDRTGVDPRAQASAEREAREEREERDTREVQLRREPGSAPRPRRADLDPASATRRQPFDHR